MKSIAICTETLGKEYHTGGTKVGYKTFRDTLQDAMVSPFRRAGKLLRGQATGAADLDERIWALKDVSLEIRHGEVVGIIGSNGAGKSTLLKILSSITEPTRGFAEVKGRVGTLLEVGTGFHPELTGRENTYLNGAILGMKKVEIDRKFREITAFAEVEKFIDTPVKHYSTGMSVRLAFAVAAHLEPDILLVDEVLAVGDAAFQKKCLGAMDRLGRGGRTVLLVSHNMAAVENLCQRAIWIDKGQIRQDGDARDVIKAYLSASSGNESSNYELANIQKRRGSGELRFLRLEMLDQHRHSKGMIYCGDRFIMRLWYSCKRQVQNPHFAVDIFTNLGTKVTSIDTWTRGYDIPYVNPGEGYLDLEINFLNLRPDRYYLSLWSGSLGANYDRLDHCAVLDVVTSDVYNSGRELDSRRGIIFLEYDWRLNETIHQHVLRDNGDAQ